jgi:hypothetical protein
VSAIGRREFLDRKTFVLDRVVWRYMPDPATTAAANEVPFVPWGQYVQSQVFSRRVRGVLKFAAPVIWNVWLEA